MILLSWFQIPMRPLIIALGAFFDSSSAELTVFIDGDSDANSANVDSYKITLTGNSAFDLNDLNLASPVIPV